MEIEYDGRFLAPIKGVVSEKLISHSLANQCRPQYEKYKHMAGWIYIDKLCEKLRTSTGFTHSLQSLELDPEDAIHAFNKPNDTLEEKRYLQYHACRGSALMEAVKHYNQRMKRTDDQNQAL
jgi:peptidyl-tRNA hydrolase